jgi:transcriptional regulator with XRE-family HTH domain
MVASMGLIHDQLRARRKQLGLRQKDMPLRAGIARQQYHRLENGGNPSLKTLELAAAGLNLVLTLVPKERWSAVRAVMERPPGEVPVEHLETSPSENPWKDLLGSADDE